MISPPRVSVINLGCPKNRVDAEIILAELAQDGFEITADPDDAQIIIVNTCGFLAEAVEESAEVIENYQAMRRAGQLDKLLVTGCLPQRTPRELVGRFPWVDAFVGIDQIPDIPTIIKESTRRGEVLVSPTPTWNPDARFARFISTPGHYAYLRLTEGCSNHCSYCTIPAIRGELRVRETDDILKEAGDLVALGVKELILIAQDTTAHPELGLILDGLDRMQGVKWVRLMYTHPGNMTEKLLEQIAASPRILNYIDIPVQHLVDGVLRAMNRGVGYEKIAGLVRKARGLDPGFALRTTVIVGFPGETGEEFALLKARLEELRFTHLGVFLYSPEEGTEAARMDDQIQWKVKEARALELIELAEGSRTEEISKLTETRQMAVIDYLGEEEAIGRLWSDAPEIDRILKIQGKNLQPGEFGLVNVTGGEDDYIFADWLKPD